MAWLCRFSLLRLVAVALIPAGCAGPSEVEDVARNSEALGTTPLFAELTLQNGWTNSIARNAGVALSDGIVHFKGSITTTGTNPIAFTLPAGFRPATNAYVAVSLCGPANGRLFIQPSGVVTVQAESAFSDAQCSTSLEGASFAPSASGFTALTLQNGWANAPFGTSSAAFREVNGIVHFKGAIATSGTNPIPFTLPSGSRPATNVYVPIDLCSATKGRLFIAPSGTVTVVATGGAFSNAQCFTSLDGAWFARDTSGAAHLRLENGWSNAPFGTSAAGATVIGGITYLRGAISGGTTPEAFNLDGPLFPTAPVHVPADLCSATRGALSIGSFDGNAVETAGGGFGSAQCFTSLDGVSYTISDFTPLTLRGGWTRDGSSLNPAVALISGIVRFQGGLQTSGTDPVPFTLPVELRPAANVYVPVATCGDKGRLFIQPSGTVTVQTDGPFSAAQCRTALEGASYALSTSSFTALTLQNGWTNAPFGTRSAAATTIAGFVQLAGAIGGGTNGQAFTLPAGLRPPSTVYLPVDLCNATKGRLVIQPSGVATVSDAGGGFVNAPCFTSLEGVSFATAAPALFDLQLTHGWTSAPFGNRPPKYSRSISGIVHLAGAIASGADAGVFMLPPDLYPRMDANVAVDLCNGHKGSLQIHSSGIVAVFGTLSDAQCFLSLDGVTYPL